MIETKFKHTEIGLIPYDWEVKELRQLCKVNGRVGFRGYNKSDLVPRGMGAYTIGCKHISKNRLDLSDPEYISWRKYYESPEIMVKMGDILLAQRGTLGVSAIVSKDIGPATINPSLVLLNKIQCNNLFLSYYLKTKESIDEVSQNASLTSIPMISQKQIELLRVILPPTTVEQKRIADALSKIDSLITDLDALIDKKRAIKAGTMQQLLTGKKRLEGYTEPWVEKTIDDISELKKGGGLSKEKLTPRGKHKCILYGEIFTAYNYIVKKCKSKTNYEEGLFSKVGDVLMPGSTTTKGIDLAKAVCVMEDNILLGGDIIVIRNCKNAFDPLFLSTYLSEINKQAIAEIAQGITIIHIHAKQVAEVKLVIPPTIEEQNAIASILSSMDTEIAALEQKRDKYIAIKQGMMQNLLTGKIRLV